MAQRRVHKSPGIKKMETRQTRPPLHSGRDSRQHIQGVRPRNNGGIGRAGIDRHARCEPRTENQRGGGPTPSQRRGMARRPDCFFGRADQDQEREWKLCLADRRINPPAHRPVFADFHRRFPPPRSPTPTSENPAIVVFSIYRPLSASTSPSPTPVSNHGCV